MVENFFGEAEERPRIIGVACLRPHCHKTFDPEAGEAGELPDERLGVFRQNPGFLGFAAAVNLNEDRHDLALLAAAFVDFQPKLQGIDGLYEVKNLNRPADLVPLEVADEMPFDLTSDDCLGRGRFLDIILADDLDAGFDRHTDFFRSPGLSGGDKLDVRGELLEDGSDFLPDHEILINRIGPYFQVRTGGWRAPSVPKARRTSKFNTPRQYAIMTVAIPDGWKPRVIGPDQVEVLVVGTGLMGASLAQAIAQNGVGVGLVGRRQESLDRARGSIRFDLDEAVEKGVFSRAQTEQIGERIRSTLNLEEACRGRSLRLVIESISENAVLKRELFNWLDEFSSPDVVLASNTSFLDAEALAAETGRPDRFVWMHFFFPAHKNRAAEYSGLSGTSEKTLAVAAEFLAKIGKTAVRLRRYRKGGVANIIFAGLILEAMRMVNEGYGSASVEGAGRAAFGVPVGFVRLLESVGLDLAVSCLESFSDPSSPEHHLASVYDNFFSLPAGLKQKFYEAKESGKLISLESLLTPKRIARPDSPQVAESLKRRFLAVAFMTSVEVVEAGLTDPAAVDTLCRTAFIWSEGPFALMNRLGILTSLQIVTEQMEMSHRQEINFPVPRILVKQAGRNEPWPL